MSRYRRDRTPDSAADEPRQRFHTIIRNANIERRVGEQVYTFFESVREKFNLEGDPMEWLVPGAYAIAVAQKVPTGDPMVQLSVLLKSTGLNVTQFFNRLRKWTEISPVSPAVREVFSQAERYFQLSRTVFERYEAIFLSVFRDPIDPEMPRSNSLEKSVRKKKPAQPKYIQPIDLYIFAWDLFIRVRRAATTIRDDLVSCYHILMCVVDLVAQNVLALKRRDLFNPECSVLPAEVPEPEQESEQKPKEQEKVFTLLPYLCAHFDGIYVDCKTMFSKVFSPIIDALIELKILIAEKPSCKGMLVPERYEVNLMTINSTYEDMIHASCTVDERTLLVSPDLSLPTCSGDPLNPVDVYNMLKERRKANPIRSRKLETVDFQTPRPVQPIGIISPSPLTPTSSYTALERREAQESVKSPALNTAVDLVSKLTAMAARRTNAPSKNLTEILTQLYDKDVSKDFTRLSGACRELLVNAYIEKYDATRMAEPFVRQRFLLAETWFFKLLEDVLVCERKRSRNNTQRMKKLVDSEKFQKALFAMAIEMVLYSYNLSRMFPWPLEVLKVDPYDFVKIIEPVVHLEPLPSPLIRHLGHIEETILEQIVWKTGSPVWEDIAKEEVLPVKDVAWPHNLDEQPSVESQMPTPVPVEPTAAAAAGPSTMRRKSTPSQHPAVPVTNGANQSEPEPTPSTSKGPLPPPAPLQKPAKNGALCFFFRKVYVLASSRLRDLCLQLGFTEDIERNHHVFQRMFTLFEHALTKHTDLLKDRHLDQILLCCAYVVAKLEASNGLDKSFHQIMHAYRFQPQAESKVYRSVLIGPKPATTSHPHDTRRKAAQALTQGGLDGEGDEIRADIINFYNQIFVRAMQNFIGKFSPKKKAGAPAIQLSPVPKPITNSGGRRQVHPAGQVFVSPLKKEQLASPAPNDGRVLTFTFGVSGQQKEALLAAANSIPFPMPHRVPKYPLKKTDTAPLENEAKRIKMDPAQVLAALAAADPSLAHTVAMASSTRASSMASDFGDRASSSQPEVGAVETVDHSRDDDMTSDSYDSMSSEDSSHTITNGDKAIPDDVSVDESMGQ